MKEKISDKLRIEHAMNAVHEIQSFIHSKTFEDFNSDSMLKSACMHVLVQRKAEFRMVKNKLSVYRLISLKIHSCCKIILFPLAFSFK